MCSTQELKIHALNFPQKEAALIKDDSSYNDSLA